MLNSLRKCRVVQSAFKVCPLLTKGNSKQGEIRQGRGGQDEMIGYLIPDVVRENQP